MQIGNLLATHLQKSREYSCNKFTPDLFNLCSIDHSEVDKFLDEAGDRKKGEGKHGILGEGLTQSYSTR